MDSNSELVDGSRAPGRAVARRRRTLVGAVLIACLAAWAVLAWSLDRAPTSGDDSHAQGHGPVRLPAVVSTSTPHGQQAGSATWDARARELVYLSSAGYSSSCPPTATARSDGHGAVAIELDEGTDDGACTADAAPVAVTVRGLVGEPVSLTVAAAAGGGPAPIVPLGVDGPDPGVAMRLPCATTTAVVLDISGPGRRTPEEAVHPYLGAHVVHLIGMSRRHATVTAMNVEGEVRRTYAVTLREDGWWPDGYDECLS